MSFLTSSLKKQVHVDRICWRTWFVLVSGMVEGCNGFFGLDVNGSGRRMGRWVVFNWVFLDCACFLEMDYNGTRRRFRLGRWTVRRCCLSGLVRGWGCEEVRICLSLTIETYKSGDDSFEALVAHSILINLVSFGTKIGDISVKLLYLVGK